MDDKQLLVLQGVVNDGTAKGDWTGKPAIPASTTPVTNNSGRNMFVEIAGGTVTVVKVDGVTVGARVAGSFFVRAGSTIAITYSVAPTWQWFYA